VVTVTNKRKDLSVEGKFKITRETGNGEKIKLTSGIWSRKLFDPNYLEKESQNYQCA
jgi:hypothetical protein